MSAAAVNDIVAFTIQGQCFGQRILFTQTFRIESLNAAVVERSILADDIIAPLDIGGGHDLITGYLACLSQNYLGDEARAQFLFPERLRPSVQAVGVPGTRGVTNTANVASSLTLVSQKSGRSEVGTKKMGPIAAADSVNGSIVVGLSTAISNFANDLILPFNTAGAGGTMQPVIYHRGVTTLPGLYSDVWDFGIGTTTRVNRRRAGGLGV